MNCPSCHNNVEVLEKNFGALFTCPQCQAVYFLNFEGLPEYSEVKKDSYASTENFSSSNFSSSDVVADSPSSENAVIAEENVDFFAASDPLVNSFEHPLNSTDAPAFLTNQDSEFSQTAQEISDFGNSEVQISGLNYDLQIAGLDSQVELVAFKEAITDSRFGWEVSDLMKRIKNGQLNLERLNAVQAFILAKRIHFLKLELKWKQNVLD